MKPFGVEFLEPLPPDATFGGTTSGQPSQAVPITGPTKIIIACVTLWVFVDTDEVRHDFINEDIA